MSWTQDTQKDAVRQAAESRAHRKQRRQVAERERSIASLERLVSGMSAGPERIAMEIQLRDAKLALRGMRARLGIVDPLTEEHAELAQG
jgi:hypothetical protein